MYVGRISRGPFDAWTQTPEGQAVVSKEASRITFALFGKTWAARRRLWRALSAAASDERVVTGIQREVDAFFERLGEAAYAADLPKTAIEFRRLVAVPRIIINTAAHKSMSARLGADRTLIAAGGGEDLRDFLYVELINQIDVAIAKAQPSPKRPLAAGDEWIAVGTNAEFVWQTPFRGPAWPGHYFVFELSREKMTRSIRKAIAARIPDLESSASALSRLQRIEVMRRAGTAA